MNLRERMLKMMRVDKKMKKTAWMKKEFEKDGWKMTLHPWGFLAIDNLEDENESYVWQNFDDKSAMGNDEYAMELYQNGDYEELFAYLLRLIG